MAPRTQSEGPQPLPLLPTELEREILRFCDTPTVANASLVSLAFLELASPFLYDEITIQGMYQLFRLLKSADQPPSNPPPPHLAPFLSLSQTRTINFVGIQDDEEWDELLSLHRFSSSSPLQIRNLSISFNVEPGVDEHEESWSILLNLFNPVHVNLTTSMDKAFAWIPFDQAVWTEVKSISFERCMSESPICLSPMFVQGRRDIVVAFDISTFKREKGARMMDLVLDEVAGGGEEDVDDWRGCLLDVVDEVKLVVGNEEQERACQQVLEERWEGRKIATEERSRMKGRVQFVRESVVSK